MKTMGGPRCGDADEANGRDAKTYMKFTKRTLTVFGAARTV
jgi:hypothetical protein